MSELNNEWSIISSDSEYLKKQLNSLNKKISFIQKKLEDKEELTKKIEKLEEDNNLIISMLKENRELYLRAISEVGEKEDKNFNELKPLIRDNNFNFSYPTSIVDRLSNRYWRTNYTTTPNISIVQLNNDLD